MKRLPLWDGRSPSLLTTLAIVLALTLGGCTGCQTEPPPTGLVDTGVSPDGADADTSDSSGPDADTDADTTGGVDSDTVPPIDVDPPNACIPAGEGPAFKVSARADLRWKRVGALKNDLLTALQLTEAEACAELGIKLPGICFNMVYLVSLGGNDPVGAAMYRPMEVPSITTALSVDRVVVQACGRRVDVDSLSQRAGEPMGVFTYLDLNQEAIDVTTPGLQSQIESLYKRFLARMPSKAEVQTVLELAAPLNGVAVTARDFAKAACFTIATTTEFIFH
jgi:hypothetical protein